MFDPAPMTDEYFDKMCGWWKKRNFPSPSKSFLPPDGRVVLWQGEPIAGGFLFKSNANIAIIGHLVSDKNVPFEIRSKAVDYLVVSLTALSKKDGFNMVTCSTNLPGLSKRFEALGFTKTDENVSQFGRVF